MKQVTTLRDKTRQLLIDRPASLATAAIAKEIDVSTGWLNAFARGEIPDPGVVKIETLYQFLTNFAKKAC